MKPIDDELQVRDSLPAGVPDVLFDGFAVLNALSDKAEARTSSENVSDVLDAVVKLLRDEAAPTVKAEPVTAQDERDLFKPYRLAGEFCVSRGIDDDSEIRPKILDAFCSGYACADRPVQTAPVPAQVQCDECGGNGAGGDHEDDCSKAPSLPADGSPDFTLDGGSQPCYYAETVQRIVAALSAQTAPQGLRIVLDGPPGPEAGRFVEVENAAGRSVNAGEWRERADGLWELVLHAAQGGE
jgi:hypothetical protein